MGLLDFFARRRTAAPDGSLQRATAKVAASQASVRMPDRSDDQPADIVDEHAGPVRRAAPAMPERNASGDDDVATQPPVLTQFHQLPNYQALLTVGLDAVYHPPVAMRDKLVALDCGGRRSRLVCVSMSSTERAAIEGTLNALMGALRARSYRVVGEHVAEPHVLKEILRNAGGAGKGGSLGGPCGQRPSGPNRR